MRTLTKKLVMPKSRMAGLRFISEKSWWDYDVRIIREDGSQFRRAGSAPTEQEARHKRDAAYAEFNTDEGRAREQKKAARKAVAPDIDTFRGFTERVLPLIRSEMAPTTFEAYNHALENHVLPTLGDLALEEVRSLVITEHLQKLRQSHSLGVASQARSALARVLEIAAIDGRIPANPVKAVRIGARERKVSRIERAQSGDTGKRWLSLSEGKELLASVRGTPIYWPILLGLRFGLRSGEAMGLTWEHVDLRARVIRVRQQAQYLKGIPRHVCPPKSAAGVRDVPIPADLVDELADAKDEAARSDEQWVCVDDGGTPIHPKHVTRFIKNAVCKAGFNGEDGKPVPTSHDFRSSYLTWLANHANDGLGVKPHVLMAIAGHSDINMAMKYYVKADVDDLAVAVNSLAF